MTHHPTHRRAFFTGEISIGIALITVLATALAVAATKSSHCTNRLEESRRATEAARRALLAVQRGKPAPAEPDATVVVRTLGAESGWVKVEARLGKQTATLIGRVNWETTR